MAQPANESFDYIETMADEFVGLNPSRAEALDYSIGSLAVVDEILGELFGVEGLDDETVDSLSNMAGCYISEAVRRAYGGSYKWYDELGQPILVVGDGSYEVAFTAAQKAKGRVQNGEEDNITFFIQGVIQKIDAKQSALIV